MHVIDQVCRSVHGFVDHYTQHAVVKDDKSDAIEAFRLLPSEYAALYNNADDESVSPRDVLQHLIHAVNRTVNCFVYTLQK